MSQYDQTKTELVEFYFRNGKLTGPLRDYCQRIHPTERAEAFRELERGFGGAAKQQEAENERIGVPDRAVTP